ncbi:hypothetical protein SNE40_018135 [Patella caerulea]|uniref:FP protein C-terminal domain-containing protein n=1 Tax=Patella caerulea TaxID=87958 RepID=A0AAN8J970_PATCE
MCHLVHLGILRYLFRIYKRDQPESRPDNSSPSKARLASLDGDTFSTTSDNNDTSEQSILSTVQNETVLQLSQVVCATLKNQDFMDSILPLISEKVIQLIKPNIAKIVDECMKPHLETINHNTDALDLHEAQFQNHNDQIKILSNKVMSLEKRLEEQEQYSRRTSLRFNTVRVPTKVSGNIITPIDTDSLVLDICKKQLGVKLNLNDIGRSHPIGEIRDGKTSIIVRFPTYRQRQTVFSQKKKLKDNVDKIFITENLTRHRYDLLKRLNTLRTNKKIDSFWTHDGTVLVKETEHSRPAVVKNRQDIYKLGGEVLSGDEGD